MFVSGVMNSSVATLNCLFVCVLVMVTIKQKLRIFCKFPTKVNKIYNLLPPFNRKEFCLDLVFKDFRQYN